MKKVLVIILLFFSTHLLCNAAEIVLKGVYQGKNLYVMNPFSSSGVGFCVYEVTVNGQLTTDEINSSAFEIDLAVFQFKIGDKLIVVIKHKDGCVPKVINPEVLKPQSTFVDSNGKVNKDRTLTWSTTGESGSLPFIVEQFRWNKWVTVATIDGNGTLGTNQYSAKVDCHDGNNRFRVKQIDYTRKPRFGKEIRYRSMDPEVTYTIEKSMAEIVFSRETMYEIYDYYGNLVDKGIAAKVNISSLTKGDYFINYGTKTETFKKK